MTFGAGELPEGRDEADLEQEQLGAQRRPPLSRGARWQLGLAAVLALAMTLLTLLILSIPRQALSFVLWSSCCSPPTILAILTMEILDVGAPFHEATLFVVAFIVIVLLLLPLRRWIDDPDRRAHHVRTGVEVGVVYVVMSFFLGWAWWIAISLW